MNTAWDVTKGLIAFGPTYGYAFMGISKLILPTLTSNPQEIASKASDLVPGLFERVAGIRNDILVQFSNGSEIADALGSSSTPRAIIMIDKKLKECSDNVFSYMLKREVCSIHLNETQMNYVLTTLCLAIIGIAISILDANCSLAALPLIYAVPYLVHSRIYSAIDKKNQLRVDTFTMKNATDNELREMVDFLLTISILVAKFINRAPRGVVPVNNRRTARRLPRSINDVRMETMLKELRERNVTMPPVSPERTERYHKFKEYHKKAISDTLGINVD